SPLRETQRGGSFTDLGVVGRIEVISGPSATEGVGAAGGIINYISKTPTKMGNEFTLTSKYQTQFEDDSGGWKLGFEFARKQEEYDLLLATSEVERGIGYDGNGRRIGMNASGSLQDTHSRNLFLKFGSNFAPDQRLEATISRFHLIGNGNYIYQVGDRTRGLTDTSIPGRPQANQTEFNDFKQYGLNYKHEAVLGGTLTANFYRASQAMRFVAEPPDTAKQDPLFAPLGTLVEQSEVNSQKRGVRTGWTRGDLFNVAGLELRTGVDVVQDRTEQKLALTNRTWVPPMLYKSTAPYAQVSYDVGPLTLSGGYRREDGELDVKTYTTLYAAGRNTVQGGVLDYKANLPNAGAVWRIGDGWSTFVSYSKGFALPNVGIPLRNVRIANQAVTGILDLQAVIVDNKEVGVNWRGRQGSFGISTYNSTSELGVSLAIDPVTNDFVMLRQPTDIKGIELQGEYIMNNALRANMTYSRIRGKTVFVTNGPLDKDMGISDISPDKLGASINWNASDKTSVRLSSSTFMDRNINIGKSGEEKTKGYTLLDLTATHRTRYGDFTLGVENLMNKFYIITWAQVPGFQNYFAGRGRMVSLTHQIKF
ncbi:MAG TPA: TonB-dependent receptor, partial [Burkholderiaceae bacterium]